MAPRSGRKSSEHYVIVPVAHDKKHSTQSEPARSRIKIKPVLAGAPEESENQKNTIIPIEEEHRRTTDNSDSLIIRDKKVTPRIDQTRSQKNIWHSSKEVKEKSKRPNIFSKPVDIEKILTTDDSGRVISIKQWRDLHESADMHKEVFERPDQLSSRKPKTEPHTFSEIAKTKEKKQPAHHSQKHNDIITCRYCGKLVERKKIGLHNKLNHPRKFRDDIVAGHNQNPPDKSHPPHREQVLAPKGKDGNVADAFRNAFKKASKNRDPERHEHDE